MITLEQIKTYKVKARDITYSKYTHLKDGWLTTLNCAESSLKSNGRLNPQETKSTLETMNCITEVIIEKGKEALAKSKREAA